MFAGMYRRGTRWLMLQKERVEGAILYRRGRSHIWCDETGHRIGEYIEHDGADTNKWILTTRLV